MNWGNVQIESLKKMFLNNDYLNVEELEEYKKSKKYKTYLFAMPQACNEAIHYIWSLLHSNEKIGVLKKKRDVNLYNLTEEFENFGRIKDILNSNIKWKMLNQDIVQILDWESNEDLTIIYEVKPNLITSETSKEYMIELPEEYINIIPLYIAGELYKDDDITLATMYMNEFMNMVDLFATNQNYINNPEIKTIYSIE